ncbi:peptidoglycan DD-metalloendopeptidase family protein [Shimazuella sp. AN120528]|uniref:murein hydrolase activator EnvC family protein n=1 Tax=Shimazuella soli TaxID=1892854 RepID=UPI001F10CC95|nr:M23 family metallopeptidase [Shimazuella soli]MCH5585309.1 peptidoglycan DD-metalloendopeptidase family protein [Shimazuella soli]
MRRLFIASLSTCLAFSLWGADAYAAPSKKSEQQEKLKHIQENKKSKNQQLGQAQSELNQLKKEIAPIEKQMDQYDTQLLQLNKDIAANEKLLKQQQKQLNARVIHLYQSGEMGYMGQLISAKTFGEFFARVEGIRLIVKNDSNLLTEYKQTAKSIAYKKKSIEVLRAKIQPLFAKEKAKIAEIEKKTQGISKELANIQHDEEVTEAAIKEQERLEKLASQQYSGNFGTGVLMKPGIGSITSGFGYRWGRQHKGIDIDDNKPGPDGKKIFAADDGVVILTKSDPDGFGYYIVIKHSDELSTLYGHMYRSTVRVSVGEHVKKGQWIADIGNNGHSTGSHLHFEVHKNGEAVDPMPYIS